jgi:ABC-type antimicrobial peptide transport system permease subunit
MIAAGAIVGLISALALSRVLSSLLFSVGPRDPVAFVFVMVLLLGVAAVAAFIPARAATRVNPIVALRCD